MALKAMKEWIKSERCKLGTAALMEKLRAKLQGHFNYYGFPATATCCAPSINRHAGSFSSG